VISSATGLGRPTVEEHELLSGLIAKGRVATVRGLASMTGSAVSAMFPAALAMAALATKRGGFLRPMEQDPIETTAPATGAPIVVTTVGVSTGEGIGLVEAVH